MDNEKHPNNESQQDQQMQILYSVMRAEGLYSLSERKRALAMLLKMQQVPSRIIGDLIGVSNPSIQGWWRDWQVDPDFKSLIDRRRAYSIQAKDKDRVIEYLEKGPPAGLDAWSIKALSKVLKIKLQDVETILKVLCREVPERVPGDEHMRAGVYETQSPLTDLRGKRRTAEPINPDRQRVFDDALDFIDKLESGIMPNDDRQQVFDDVLSFVEAREDARKQGIPYEESKPAADEKKSAKRTAEKQNPDLEKQREQCFADAMDFINSREEDREDD